MLSTISSTALRTSAGKSLLPKTALRSFSTVLNSSIVPRTTQTVPVFLPTKIARFSSDSHDDFSPKKKAGIEGEDDAMKLIKEHVENNRVMLYMKGNPSMPMCGFSARVVEILQKEGVDFSSVNVLDYPAVREGVKKFSDWPTIPQLYINGEFIGGCDIITSMHENGELKEVLAEDKK